MFDLGYPLLVVVDSGSRSNSKGHHSPSRNLLNYHDSNSTVRFLGKESEDVFSITISRHATMAEKSFFFAAKLAFEKKYTASVTETLTKYSQDILMLSCPVKKHLFVSSYYYIYVSLQFTWYLINYSMMKTQTSP